MGEAIDLVRQLERIDPMEEFEAERKRMTDFVLLQVPDEMPAGAPWQKRDFCACLLDAAFAEKKLTRSDRF
jgi:hypothetical protein